MKVEFPQSHKTEIAIGGRVIDCFATPLREAKQMTLNVPGRPLYSKALNALNEAHQACFKHPDRDLLGMSSGPFSGVNEALGIISLLEEENIALKARLAGRPSK